MGLRDAPVLQQGVFVTRSRADSPTIWIVASAYTARCERAVAETRKPRTSDQASGVRPLLTRSPRVAAKLAFPMHIYVAPCMASHVVLYFGVAIHSC